MTEAESITKQLAKHCLEDMSYLQVLLNTGALPEGWASKYLELLASAKAEYAEKDLWPRELVGAAYTVSVYCPKRYRDWQRLSDGKENLETEQVMRDIRWAADDLLISPFLTANDETNDLTSMSNGRLRRR